ncbi:MAG: T9SS type A sorting domain-containing protein, partial [Chitinophagales bacterium]
SYTAGSLLAANSALWTTWSGGTASEDALVSDAQAYSESNSVYIVGNTGPTDLVLPFPSDYTSGVYELKMKMYIVIGKGAYFNLQQSAVPGIAWMLEVYFDNAGGGNALAGGATIPISYNPGTWNDIKVSVDLNNDLAVLYINSASVYNWQWSLGATGTGAQKMWGGMNIFAYAFNAQDAEFYVDDVVLSKLAVNDCPQPIELFVSNLTSTSAKVQWNVAPGAIGYKIFYHQDGNPAGIKKSSSGNSKKLGNLLPNTTYKWAVQSICANQPLIASPFTMGPDFTTPPLRLLNEQVNAPLEAGIFPNPASDNTTISFSLYDASPITIRLIDLNGKVIDEISNAMYPEGSHQVTFNSSDVPSGLYLLQLATNKEVVTSKLVIER